MAKGKLELKMSGEDEKVAYLSMPAHPGEGSAGIVTKTLRLRDICEDYSGPDIYLDFSEEKKLLGIEIV